MSVSASTPSRLDAGEVFIDISSKLSEKDWREIFDKDKKAAKCNNSCLSGYGPSAKSYNGHDGKCVYCGFQK